MAKKSPSSIVAAVRLADKKNCQWYVKVGNRFERSNFKAAVQALRDTGLTIAQATEALNEMKAKPFTEVSETKSGNFKFA